MRIKSVYILFFIAALLVSCVEANRDNINDPGADNYRVPAPVPANLSATDGTSTDSITITWEVDASSADYVSKYQLYRALSETAEYTMIAEPTDVTYTDTNCGVGKHYWYRVNSVSDSGIASDGSTADSGYRLMTWTRLTEDATVNPGGQPSLYGHVLFYYGDEFYIEGGYNGGTYPGLVLNSSDGISYIYLNSPSGDRNLIFHTGVNFDPGTGELMWIIGGLRSDGVTYSTLVAYDAGTGFFDTTGVAVLPTGRAHHTAVVYNGKIWLIGGQVTGTSYTNTVLYSSSDVTSWTDAGASGHFSARFDHASVVFDDRMWVIGGFQATSPSYQNDVWSSSDGITWIRESAYEVTTGNKFSGRYGHRAIVFQDAMWVIGGQDNSVKYNDVWCSVDGINWTCVTAAADFGARAYHACVIYDDKIYIYGGTGTSADFDDVWVSNN